MDGSFGVKQPPTVAERIETHDQLDRVLSLGLKFGQGYLFSKLVPAGKLKVDLVSKDIKSNAA
jgi:EAL domain-containing protein (putative c-di-GMP-specific phosphodiesterase class I)